MHDPVPVSMQQEAIAIQQETSIENGMEMLLESSDELKKRIKSEIPSIQFENERNPSVSMIGSWNNYKVGTHAEMGWTFRVRDRLFRPGSGDSTFYCVDRLKTVDAGWKFGEHLGKQYYHSFCKSLDGNVCTAYTEERRNVFRESRNDVVLVDKALPCESMEKEILDGLRRSGFFLKTIREDPTASEARHINGMLACFTDVNECTKTGARIATGKRNAFIDAIDRARSIE